MPCTCRHLASLPSGNAIGETLPALQSTHVQYAFIACHSMDLLHARHKRCTLLLIRAVARKMVVPPHSRRSVARVVILQPVPNAPAFNSERCLEKGIIHHWSWRMRRITFRASELQLQWWVITINIQSERTQRGNAHGPSLPTCDIASGCRP
jgi:hypothetical protein